MDFYDISDFTPPDWTGKYPPCQIQVNRDGELFHNRAPIIHPGIRELIFASVRYEDGVYLLELEGRRCQLEVADTFWVIMRAELANGSINLTLNSKKRQPLDPDSLWVGRDHVMYCRIGQSRMPARFTRPAYYQLAQWIEEEPEGYALCLNGNRHKIAYPGI